MSGWIQATMQQNTIANASPAKTFEIVLALSFSLDISSICRMETFASTV